MITAVDGIYGGGQLLLQQSLALAENSRARVASASGAGREASLELSPDNSLPTWNNPADDAFNQLLLQWA